jgi:glucose/arabinose dehydrogenase
MTRPTNAVRHLFAAGLAATTLALVASCTNAGGGTPQPTAAPPPHPNGTAPASGTPTVLADRLEVPWGIAFLPDGSALVTERDRHDILKVTPAANGGRANVAKVQTIDEAVPRGEGGLLGIAVSPHYATDGLVFVYYSTGGDNRIARMRLGDPPQPIVTGIPHSPIHNGGRLGFGPDGFLYASTGDGSDRGLAQDKSSLAGKILRMNPDGTPAAGNPFGTLVYSYGHRNVQGFGWTSDGAMYASEFGQDRFDELNRILPGRNYGWPDVEGVGRDPNFVNPLVTWPTSEASCSGLAIRERAAILGCLRGQRLYVVNLADDGTLRGEPAAAFAGSYGRLRTVVAAPDGSVWFTTSNRDGRGSPRDRDDQILRLTPGT